MNLNESEQQPVPNFVGVEVTRDGRVYLLGVGAYSKGKANSVGYHIVDVLRIGGNKYVQQLVHRLVAMTYIPNPYGYPVVDHINRVKHDNRVENLRWCTVAENSRNIHRPEDKKGKPVEQYSKDGTFLQRWISAKKAARSLVEDPNNYKRIVLVAGYIMDCCSGRIKHSQGFVWQWEPKPVTLEEDWRSTTIILKGKTYQIDASIHGELRLPSGRVTDGHNDGRGYRKVALGKNLTVCVHTVVCYAWHGKPSDPTATVDHIDRHRANNRPDNLRWATPSEQMYNRTPFKAPRHSMAIIHTIAGHETFYESQSAATKARGTSFATIRRALTGKPDRYGNSWRLATAKEIADHTTVGSTSCIAKE